MKSDFLKKLAVILGVFAMAIPAPMFAQDAVTTDTTTASDTSMDPYATPAPVATTATTTEAPAVSATDATTPAKPKVKKPKKSKKKAHVKKKKEKVRQETR